VFGNTAPRFDNKLVIVVYQNGIDFERRFGRQYPSHTVLDPKTQEHRVYLWGRATRWVNHNMVGQAESRGSVLRQALTHTVLARQISVTVLPVWLMHGLGGYVEPLAWAEDGSTVELGAQNATLKAQYTRDHLLGFTDVTGPQHFHPFQQEAYLKAFDGYCWALIFTAINLHPKELGEYLAALGAGLPADPTMIFGGLSPEAIDQEVQQFIQRGRYSLRTVKVEPHLLLAKVSPVTEEELAYYSPPPP
jgi:hypothetical protein